MDSKEPLDRVNEAKPKHTAALAWPKEVSAQRQYPALRHVLPSLSLTPTVHDVVSIALVPSVLALSPLTPLPPPM